MVPDGNVLGIDLLVAFMTLAAARHAHMHASMELLLASLALGAATEYGAIRFGGTHCHRPGIINFAQCSSVNSVVFYGPWIYSSVVAAQRLAGTRSRWALPWLCGAFSFGMCGVYEMQGPNMRWWTWPDPETGVLLSVGPRLNAEYAGILEGAEFWRASHLQQGNDFVISAHAGAALHERVWSVQGPGTAALPIMAPYFDMAFGWGVGFVLWLAPGAGTTACVLLGAVAALLWDLPVRVLELCGVDKWTSVPVLMVSVCSVTVICISAH